MAPVARVRRYWEEHRDFFTRHGIHTWDDASAFPYRFKIAQLRSDLDRENILMHLGRADHIVDVYLT